MRRIKLCDRVLPVYSKAEECFNAISHIIGVALGLTVLAQSLITATIQGSGISLLCAAVYGASMIALYTMSAIYHGLHPGTAKKVFQILDHCTIYFLIAGTYLPIVLCAIRPEYPVIGWGLFAAEYLLAIIATVFTAIDLKAYRVYSMICYIGMGWAVIFFLPQTIAVMTLPGFRLLLAGGIAYTVGAVLFGLGRKLKWMHSAFHVFVLLGSILQYLAIILYVF